MLTINSKPILAALGCAVAIIGIYVFSNEELDFSVGSHGIVKNQLSPQQRVASSEDVEKLRLEIKALAKSISTWGLRIEGITKELNLLHSRVENFDELDSPMPLSSRDSKQWRQQDQEPKAKLEKSKANDQMMLIEETINIEGVDRAWSNFATSELEASLQNADFQGIEILTTDCRSTLCRITLQPDDSVVGSENFINLEYVISLLPWNSEVWFRIKDSGEVVGYLAREGYSLPNSVEESQ